MRERRGVFRCLVLLCFGFVRIRFSGAVALPAVQRRARIVTESIFGTATEKTLPGAPDIMKI
jgi:hypothetical protein